VIVLLNGAFGIGKTTVARVLARRLPGASLYDPERIGFVLQRLPRFVPLDGRGTDDYQDLPLWRSLLVRGACARRRLARTLVVPMAFSRLDYLGEIRSGLAAIDPDFHHVCLTATLATIHARLAARERAGTPTTDWMLRRAAECVEAHADPAFDPRIATDDRTPDEVAHAVLESIAGRHIETTAPEGGG